MPGGIHPPIEVILSWPTPNYIDPPTRPKSVLIVACIFGPLTLLLLLARLWVRLKMQHSAGLDDWLMVAAIGPVTALTVIFPLATERYGFNKHVWDVNPNLFVPQRKLVMAIEVVFCIAAGLIKISILLFFRRLSARSVSPRFRWICWITIAFIAAYSIAFTLVPIFGCTPISAFWEQTDFVKVAQGYKYHCFNEGADVFSAGVISTVQDLATAMLPTFLYWKLQIPIRQKIALFGIFAIGYGVVIVGALRTYYGWITFFSTYDVTWSTWDNLLSTMLELHIGCMCANAPALKVFFANFLKLERLTSRSKSRSNGSKGGNSGNNTDSSTAARSSIFSVFNIFKSSSNPSSKGYISEAHTSVSVEHDGTVKHSSPKHIRKDVAFTTDSINIAIDRYDQDIEMGDWDARSGGDSETGLQALPPIPSPSTPPAAAIAQPAAVKKRDTPFASPTSRSPVWKTWS